MVPTENNSLLREDDLNKHNKILRSSVFGTFFSLVNPLIRFEQHPLSNGGIYC